MADISETSGSENGSYFDGCLLNTMEILVKDIEKRSGEKLKEPYIVYMIETRFELMIVYNFFFIFAALNSWSYSHLIPNIAITYTIA